LKYILSTQKENYLSTKVKKYANPPVHYQLIDLVWLKPANFNPFPLYKLQIRRYGPFEITGVYQEQNSFCLDFSGSPFLNMCSKLMVNWNLTKKENTTLWKLVTSLGGISHNPTLNSPIEIIKIYSSRKHKRNYQYLSTRKDNSKG
jgi:hypothetical protein